MMFYQFLINNNSDDWMFLIFSFPLIIFCVIFLAMLYSLRRAYDKGKSEIDKGDYFMHWTYGEEEWNYVNKMEWDRTWKRAIFIPLGCIGFFFFIGMLDTEFGEEVLPLAAPWIVGFFASLSILLLFYGYSLYRRTFACPREVYISPNGISYGGFYTTWNCVGTKLGKVKIIPGDVSVLEFEIMVWGKYGYNMRPMRIAIPRVHENEAEEVITKLTPA
jgi:hypothetical protein